MDRLTIVLLLVTILLTSCRGDGPEVKIYVSKPNKGGIVRKQNNELILYSDTENYRCMSKSDFDALLNWCLDPEESSVASKRRRKRFIRNVNNFID